MSIPDESNACNDRCEKFSSFFFILVFTHLFFFFFAFFTNIEEERLKSEASLQRNVIFKEFHDSRTPSSSRKLLAFFFLAFLLSNDFIRKKNSSCYCRFENILAA